MKTKPEPDLTLKGYKFELRFTDIARHKTLRRTEGGHDHREESSAYTWEGTLAIYSIYLGRWISRPFSTESFWPKDVRGLDLEDILFLCVDRYLYGIEFKNEEARRYVIDYIASELLVAQAFASRPVGFNIEVFDFRYNLQDKQLRDFGFIAHDRLTPKPGIPGRIAPAELPF